MFGFTRLFGVSLLSLFVCMVATGADAAVGRDGRVNVRAASMGDAGVARMPTMPTLSIQTVGNMTQNIPANPTLPPVPDYPDYPDYPDEPDVPDVPDVPDNPPVGPECPDGGVKNSNYTIDMCMNDVAQCVNFGALPNGLNDMFDENTRNSIFNGMGLCTPQVDKCISMVRRDCANIYRSASDVWIDFNSRRVQPEYYNFVLRKTGLSPNQAENTCWLLDKNTYGKSFAAVSNSGAVTGEYNKKIGAYNGANGNSLSKNSPMGVSVNKLSRTVDGARGHYARWDAKTATCNVRVAAYNKDEHITNTWLFGAAGDDKPAEVWMATGDTFTCNKDLFGFSLMNKTHTAAVVGIGGGTLVGAGVGAIAGHGARDFDCSRDGHREKLAKELRKSNKTRILNQFLELYDQLSITDDITVSQCNAVLDLYDKYQELKVAIAECSSYTITEDEMVIEIEVSDSTTHQVEVSVRNGKPVLDEAQIADIQAQLGCGGDACPSNLVQQIQSAISAQSDGKCRFKPINLAKMRGESIYCTEQQGCLYHDEIARDIQPLGEILDSLEILKGEESNMGKSIGIGAAVGAGAGGLATAITAYVEKNNINCRVGDNLEQVALGKSHVISSLRDFYVKWNLNLPDVIAPTATIDSCDSWKYNCSRYTNQADCEGAQFNFKPSGAQTFTLVRSVCTYSGSMCIENYPVAKSNGACK
ncbi:MAG: hypothetical protein II208_00660 [Alphaproteobacteria bacterium]|nr:hypothetical protein [Alphaproteobacteria bacterium]